MTFDLLGDVNYFAAIVAAIAFFALGAVWHAPQVFGTMWQKASGVPVPEEGYRPPPTLFIANFVAYFVFAVVISAIAHGSGTDTFGGGLVLGVFIAIGFALPMTAVIALYERKPDPMAYLLINGLYNSLGAVIMSVIVAVWS